MNTVLTAKRFAVLLAGSLLAAVPLLHARVVIHGTSVNLYKARDLLGLHVMSADGYHVGDISDFVFDFHGRPRLTDVLVTSGLFGLFGDTRVVPVAALHQQGDQCRVDLSRHAFLDVAPLPTAVKSYLANHRDLSFLDREFHVPVRPPNGRFVTYSSLFDEEVYGRDHTDIGFLTDALLNLNQHEVFYLGVVPTYPPFEIQPGLRMEIPASACVSASGWEIDLSIPYASALADAPAVSQLKNVTASYGPLGQVFHVTAKP